MRADAKDFVQKCEQCQRHADIEHAPSEDLHCLTSPWPFTQWGLDVLGPLPVASGQRKQILMGCDYFTKWVEAEALSQVTGKRVRGFIYNNIIVRFGVPHTLVMDNGK